MPRLLVHHPSEDLRVFELIGDHPVSIGRAKSSSLVLDNASISRTHAVVRSTPDGRWQIIDRASSNGVKVNGVPVKEAILKANDQVVLGEYRMRFFEDSKSREMVTYGTPQLPPNFEKVMAESAYSGSFMSVQPLSASTGRHVDRFAKAQSDGKALDHGNRLIALLYKVNRALADLKTVDEVARRALDLALEMEGAERGFTMLLDGDSIGRGDFSKGGYGFEPALVRHRPGANASSRYGAPELTISQSIIRQVMHGGLPLLVTDPQADPRLAKSESIVAAGIQSAMCAPLGVRERRSGLLYVDNFSRRGMFAVEDLNAFTVIATQAGYAIDRIRTHMESAETQPSPAIK